jgi:hypothetical protein
MVPGQGFGGRFYVYIFEVVDAVKSRKHVDVGKDGLVPRMNLSIKGDNRDYEFKEIDLWSVETGVTRSERYRLLEFRYDPELTDRGEKAPVKLSNTDKTELKKGALQDDYMYALGGSAEHLLGCVGRQCGNEDSIVRFTGLRNHQNSWVEKIIQLNDQQVTESNMLMPEWEVKFSRRALKIDRTNLRMVLAEESYGDLLTYPIPSLVNIASRDVGQDHARLNLHTMTPWDLAEHDQRRGFQAIAKERSLETATLLFQQGHYYDVEFI